jgi:hypothetical protein
MKTIILTLFIGLSALTAKAKVRPDSVFICVSKGSIAYHQTLNCRGLRSCKHQIIKVSLSDAINKYHLRECHICYR